MYVYRSWGTSHSKERDAITLHEAQGFKAYVATFLDLFPTTLCCGRFTPNWFRNWYHDWMWKTYESCTTTTVEISNHLELEEFLSKEAWWRDEE